MKNRIDSEERREMNIQVHESASNKRKRVLESSTCLPLATATPVPPSRQNTEPYERLNAVRLPEEKQLGHGRHCFKVQRECPSDIGGRELVQARVEENLQQ